MADTPEPVLVIREDRREVITRDPAPRAVVTQDDPSTVVVQESRPVVVTTAPGPRGAAGRDGTDGEQGPPGPPGGGTYTHDQTVPDTDWLVTHNLGMFPGGVTVEDSAGSVVEGDVEYVSANQILIHFSAPFAGTAYLS